MGESWVLPGLSGVAFGFGGFRRVCRNLRRAGRGARVLRGCACGCGCGRMCGRGLLSSAMAAGCCCHMCCHVSWLLSVVFFLFLVSFLVFGRGPLLYYLILKTLSKK